MPTKHWTRQQLLVAFSLYCRVPFGKFDQRNPEIAHYAKMIGRTPSALAMKLSNIASIDPAFIASGRRGLSGASNSDREMWDEMASDWDSFVTKSELALNELGQSFVDETAASEPMDFSAINKVANVKVRVGQEFFRKAVLSAYDNKCCITGLAVPALLVASHIKPWSVDEANRLNPRNGLALSAMHDKAFDLGFITLDEQLRVCVTRKLNDSEDKFFNANFLAIEGKSIAHAGKFSPAPEFLSHHRDNVYEKTRAFCKEVERRAVS